MARPVAASVDEYIAGFPPEQQAVLQGIRALIRSEAPHADEAISYAIPTFDLHGKHVCHFAGFKGHLSFFPTGQAADAFAAELTGYKGGRGTVQLPWGRPLPEDLIRRMVRYRVERLSAAAP